VNDPDGLRSHGGENILRKREARITKASIAITIMFVICHTPRVVPNVMEVALEQDAFPKWLPLLVSFNHLLITINSSFNFLFYLSFCQGNRGNSITRGKDNYLTILPILENQCHIFSEMIFHFFTTDFVTRLSHFVRFLFSCSMYHKIRVSKRILV